MENTVAFKGIPGGLRLVLAPDTKWNDLIEEVREGLCARRSFLAHGTVAFEICGRVLTRGEKRELMETLNAQVDLTGIRFDRECVARPAAAVSMDKNRVIKGMVRSGQREESEGDLIVIGDVNPGGEVHAEGNIVVLGALRGIAHAGCAGSCKSIVFALQMAPIQVRIANVVARSDETGVGAALIYLEENQMTIEPIVV